MSNILIIKHGSLGDIVQISGALKDFRESHKEDKIFILTTLPYVELLSVCPYIDGVLIDKRLPRWNILYLIKLKKLVSKFQFTKVYDLQNSSRTSFYKKFLFKKISSWSSSKTILEKGEKKSDFDKESVLDRFKTQLSKSNVETKYTLIPDFSWAETNIDQILNKYFNKKFILLFPFSSKQNRNKIWPHYNELINIIKTKHEKFEIATAPGPFEIEDAKKIKSTIILNDKKPLSIMELAGLIKKSNYVIANDTGPAHMTAHLNKKGKVLFGQHTTPEKVSIETDKFKAITADEIINLSAEKVYSEIKKDLDIID